MPPDSIEDWFIQTHRPFAAIAATHRAPAAFQNIESDLRRRRYACANHSMTGEHFGPRGEIFAGDAIHLSMRELRGSKRQGDHQKAHPRTYNFGSTVQRRFR